MPARPRSQQQMRQTPLRLLLLRRQRPLLRQSHSQVLSQAWRRRTSAQTLLPEPARQALQPRQMQHLCRRHQPKQQQRRQQLLPALQLPSLRQLQQQFQTQPVSHQLCRQLAVMQAVQQRSRLPHLYPRAS